MRSGAVSGDGREKKVIIKIKYDKLRGAETSCVWVTE